jgi:hypothetical protein
MKVANSSSYLVVSLLASFSQLREILEKVEGKGRKGKGEGMGTGDKPLQHPPNIIRTLPNLDISHQHISKTLLLDFPRAVVVRPACVVRADVD